MASFPDFVKFRLSLDPGYPGEIVLLTEPTGREIVVAPGESVDVENDNGDGTPLEVRIEAGGYISIHGKYVLVRDENGEEMLGG